MNLKKSKSLRLIIILLFFIILGVIILYIYNASNTKIIDTSQVISDNVENEEIKLKETTQQVEVEPKLSEMTLDEKIGQLFIIRPEALNSISTNNSATTKLTKEMQDSLSQYPVGGIALFSQNIVSPEQLQNFTSDLQNHSSIPLFIGIDEEGGSVARIANSKNFNVHKFENMESIGSTGNTENAYNVGKTIGTYLKEYGINLDFAPVADVNTNPKNIVIGKRAFGSNPSLVSNMVKAEISGFHETGIMTSIKHFPGHGDTEGDTHKGYVSISKTWNEMLENELVPFIDNLSTTDMVMVAHISVPNVTSDNLPSSLSSELINGKLRNELGYNGVVITDALEMGAISNEYPSEIASVKAIEAGVDIILMPNNYIEAFNGLKHAVENGQISEERINQSVSRILDLKEKYGLY